MPDEKKCFVIMPITTPDFMVDKYRDSQHHFTHVYECLFEPSIKEAGYIPIPPKAEGSDLIHAGIIQNLESADLVLCDMSCLNPNVFFEFGIRTALNKPVCIVKDEFTKVVPFDTGILNHQEYSSKLDSWEIQTESKRLISHLTTSAQKSQGVNNLWKFFGLSSSGKPYEVREGNDAKTDFIAMQLESINQRINALASAHSGSHVSFPFGEADLVDTIKRVRQSLPPSYQPEITVDLENRRLVLGNGPDLDCGLADRRFILRRFAGNVPGWTVEWDSGLADPPSSPSPSASPSASE